MNQTQSMTERTVAEIVAEDYRTAAVFEKHGIDFCCGGKIALSEICAKNNVDPIKIMQEIAEAKAAPTSRSENYAAWAPSFLMDYIVNNHHAYVRENADQIAAYAHKIASVHGGNHPELVEIASTFDKVSADLAGHMRNEEDVFFPAVKRVEKAREAGSAPEETDLDLIKRSLADFTREHEEVGDAIHKIRHLSNDYEIPGDACNTYQVTLHKLNEFEDDIHKHVHLENNILFSKATAL